MHIFFRALPNWMNSTKMYQPPLQLWKQEKTEAAKFWVCNVAVCGKQTTRNLKKKQPTSCTCHEKNPPNWKIGALQPKGGSMVLPSALVFSTCFFSTRLTEAKKCYNLSSPLNNRPGMGTPKHGSLFRERCDFPWFFEVKSFRLQLLGRSSQWLTRKKHRIWMKNPVAPQKAIHGYNIC